MELAQETDCCGTGWRRRSWARGRGSPSVSRGELPRGGSPEVARPLLSPRLSEEWRAGSLGCRAAPWPGVVGDPGGLRGP